MKNKKLIEIGVALAKGATGSFSKEESNEKYREQLNKLSGSEDGKFDYNNFRDNDKQVFRIIEEVLNNRIESGIKDQFDPYVDVRSVKFGDQLSFLPESDELFAVSEIAGGTNNLSRQRFTHGKPYTVTTGWEGVKIYEELERFLSGYIDWEELIDRIERSFKNKITEKIFAAIKYAYNSLSAPYKYGGTWDTDQFEDIVAHVEAATGMKPLVVGTRKAIRKAIPDFVSDKMKDQRNEDGYFKTIDGISFGVIPQAHKIGTDEFAIDDNFLLILPNGNEKIVKLIFEGNTLIRETNGQTNADDSQEYTVRKKYGVAVATSAKYAVYLLA
ncbi:hypothetical protein [Paenibacillus taichungensis]|uniref:hypothetical protein n=1 Tax=Paenibacillus taichungensis TaxID=484184 RepID=UPI0039A093D6